MNDPPPWAKQMRRSARKPVERAAEDHPVQRQLGLGRHGHRPPEHPLLEPAPTEHVPRVDEDGRAQRRAVAEERDQAVVVEVAIADVVADLHALHPGSHRPLQLPAGQVGVLQRHLADRDQPPAAASAQLQQCVVEDAGALHRLLGGAAVGEQHRGRRDHLHVDAVAVHVGKAHGGIPAGRRDRAERRAAEHHRRFVRTVTAQPRPIRRAEALGEVGPRLGEEVGVEVDDGHTASCAGSASAASGGSGSAPRPGWTHPQPGQVRADSSS